MRTNIDNSIFIDAVARLKGEQRIKNNLDIANALGYSEGTISEYLNNKKPVSDKFLKVFSIHYKIELSSLSNKKIDAIRKPQIGYGKLDNLILLVLEEQLREAKKHTELLTTIAYKKKVKSELQLT